MCRQKKAVILLFILSTGFFGISYSYIICPSSVTTYEYQRNSLAIEIQKVLEYVLLIGVAILCIQVFKKLLSRWKSYHTIQVFTSIFGGLGLLGGLTTAQFNLNRTRRSCPEPVVTETLKETFSLGEYLSSGYFIYFVLLIVLVYSTIFLIRYKHGSVKRCRHKDLVTIFLVIMCFFTIWGQSNSLAKGYKATSSIQIISHINYYTFDTGFRERDDKPAFIKGFSSIQRFQRHPRSLYLILLLVLTSIFTSGGCTKEAEKIRNYLQQQQ